MLEGLRKIDGSKNYYTSPDGKVYSVKEIKPYERCSRKYYKLIAEDGSRMYYTMSVVKRTTNMEGKNDVVKTTTEKSIFPKKSLTKEEVEKMVF